MIFQTKDKKDMVSKVLEKKDNKVNVNWDLFHRLETGDFWESESESLEEDLKRTKIYREVVLALKESNVLSDEKNGNFGIYLRGLNSGPRAHSNPLFFTKDDYARGYAKIAFADTPCMPSIKKYD